MFDYYVEIVPLSLLVSKQAVSSKDPELDNKPTMKLFLFHVKNYEVYWSVELDQKHSVGGYKCFHEAH